MGNPIAASTQDFLAGLNVTVRETAEESVSNNSLRVSGMQLTLEEELNLAKAVLLIASADGLSKQERGALQFLMIMSGIPNQIQRSVLDFDPEGVTLDHVSELFERGSRKAAYVLSGATTVASFDGLSVLEREQARELGEQLGLSKSLVTALIDNACELGAAMAGGDRTEVEALEKARQLLLTSA
ncbi:hypothetical protein [Paraliomyxa miuraensis]|uniref:hypothetical protein n=1 Tax=Paraliomyxa miuraensis TaxID=376150 RepID=UPI002251062B|nr:hypothetical protein [Paraliomyxa miuraensis]MCX4241573.1 hypothetical protein [Paraliomyxa miuraensis]